MPDDLVDDVGLGRVERLGPVPEVLSRVEGPRPEVGVELTQGHQAGRGKYAGMLGALLVESVPSGNAAATSVRFKIGTGLSDAQRRHPPPVGSVVVYRFRGLTDAGVPRFASFVRVRLDEARYRTER